VGFADMVLVLWCRVVDGFGKKKSIRKVDWLWR